MKTAEEFNALKEEADALNNKSAELTKEEMEEFAGGYSVQVCSASSSCAAFHHCAYTGNGEMKQRMQRFCIHPEYF